jgi:hypothetical protein
LVTDPSETDSTAVDPDPNQPKDPNAPVIIEATLPSAAGRTSSGQRAPEPEEKD